MGKYKMNEKAKKAYEYLIEKYPNISKAPNIESSAIKRMIRVKFKLNDREIHSAYCNWRIDGLGILDSPKFKDVKIPEEKPVIKVGWSKDLDKLKALYERYKKGEDIEKLAEETITSKECLYNAFAAYKKKGVLHGEREVKKQYVMVKGKKLSFEDVGNIIKRIRNGEDREKIARELRVDRRYVSNFYRRFKDKF